MIVCVRVCVCVIWFAKTRNNPTRTEIQITAWHESHTPALSRHTNGRATNSQVYFHQHHFCDPVNSWQSTMECMVPLGCTNKAKLGIKLSSGTLPAWQVNCDCLCTSMNTQWLLFCSNVWKWDHKKYSQLSFSWKWFANKSLINDF